MRVGLVFGGRSVEHVVSVRSARTVLEGLKSAGHEVVALGIAENGAWLPPAEGLAALTGTAKGLPTPSGSPRESVRHLLEAKIDVAFPIVHGTYGEDGTLQGLFEMLDLPYVGCSVTASAVAMDKLLSKRAFAAAGIPVVDYEAIHAADFARDPDAALAATARLPEPLFVKPSVGGSSVGCSQAPTRAKLKEAVAFALRFDETALVERAVKAREVEVAVLGHVGALEASVLGEIVPGKDFYDYEDKYLKDDAKLLAPAPVDDALAKRLREMAIVAMGAIGGGGMARVDFFLVETPGAPPQVYLNEINTLPGFTSVSMYPRLWALTGVALPALTDRLVQIAKERHRRRAHLDESLRAFVDTMKT